MTSPGRPEWRVLTSVEQADRDEWNAIVTRTGGSVFASYEWLLAYEQAPPEPLHGISHLTMRRDGELRLVAPLYDVSGDPHLTGYGPDYGFEADLLSARMLLGHSWYAYRNGIYSLDPPVAVADDLCDLMHQLAVQSGAPLYGFPGMAFDDALGPELQRRGFWPVETEATSAAQLSGTLEDYLQRLPSKTRREFRRLGNRYAKLGGELRIDLRHGDIEALARLVADVCERHQAPVVNSLANLQSIASVMRDQVRLLSLWSGGQMLGAFILLLHEDCLYAWIAGLDYAHHRQFGTYHALNLETLRLAHAWGVQRIEMGRGMYDFKVRHGLDPQLLVTWLRPASSEGVHLLEQGLPVLAAHCRTRVRVAEAYAKGGRTAPDWAQSATQDDQSADHPSEMSSPHQPPLATSRQEGPALQSAELTPVATSAGPAR